MDFVYNIGLYSIPAFLLLLGAELIGDRLERRREDWAQSHTDRRRAGFSTRDTLTSLSASGLLRMVKPLNAFIQLPWDPPGWSPAPPSTADKRATVPPTTPDRVS